MPIILTTYNRISLSDLETWAIFAPSDLAALLDWIAIPNAAGLELEEDMLTVS